MASPPSDALSGATQTVAILRPGARIRTRTQVDSIPPWIVLGRHELLALIHGLPSVQAGTWVALVAEALSAGQSVLTEERCQEVSGKHWSSLKERLSRTGRIKIDDGSICLVWVGLALADAAKRIAKGRKMRDGHDPK